MSNKYDFLKERIILQVCIGQYQHTLHFEEKLTISIESDYKILEDDNENVVSLSNYSSTAGVFDLIEDTIVNWIENETDMELEFKSGKKLVLQKNNNGYESFNITNKTDFYVFQ